MDSTETDIIHIIEELKFPKLGSRNNKREIFFDFVAPEVTPEMFYNYLMEKLGWPKIKYEIHYHHNLVCLNANGKIFYLRMLGETQWVNNIRFSDWYGIFTKNPGPEPKVEGEDILKIISNSRISLGLQKSPLEIFGFE